MFIQVFHTLLPFFRLSKLNVNTYIKIKHLDIEIMLLLSLLVYLAGLHLFLFHICVTNLLFL